MTYVDSDSDDAFGYADETPDWDEAEPEECTTPCPSCGAEIYDDAERCPICGDYVTHGSGHSWDGRPIWWILLGLAGIAATIATLAAF